MYCERVRSVWRRYLAMARQTTARTALGVLLVAAFGAQAATVSNTARLSYLDPTGGPVDQPSNTVTFQTAPGLSPGLVTLLRFAPGGGLAQPTQADGASCGNGAGGFCAVALALGEWRRARSLRTGAAARRHVVSRGRARIPHTHRLESQRGSTAARNDRRAHHDERRRPGRSAPAGDWTRHGHVRGWNPERAHSATSRGLRLPALSSRKHHALRGLRRCDGRVRHQRGSGARRPVRVRVRFGERDPDRWRADHVDRRRHRIASDRIRRRRHERLSRERHDGRQRHGQRRRALHLPARWLSLPGRPDWQLSLRDHAAADPLGAFDRSAERARRRTESEWRPVCDRHGLVRRCLRGDAGPDAAHRRATRSARRRWTLAREARVARRGLGG